MQRWWQQRCSEGRGRAGGGGVMVMAGGDGGGGAGERRGGVVVRQWQWWGGGEMGSSGAEVLVGVVLGRAGACAATHLMRDSAGGARGVPSARRCRRATRAGAWQRRARPRTPVCAAVVAP
eukprot:6712133-Alexandrium_andersonii.AAC.1